MHSISKKSSSFKTLTRRSQNMAKEHQQQQQVESDSPSCSPEVGDDVIDSDYEDNNNHKFDNDDEHQDVDVMSSPPPQMQVKNEESNEINRPFNTARPMKRRKSSSPDRDHRAGVNNQAGAATGDSDWAPRIKREANKLNFSIESIMQSVNQSSSSVVANQLQQQTQLQHQLLQQQQHQATINPSYPANFPPGLSGYLQIQTSAAATAALAAAAAATATPMGQQQQQRQQSMASPSFLPSHQNHRLNHHHQQHPQVVMADLSPRQASNANCNNNNTTADSPSSAYSPAPSSSSSSQSSPAPSIGSGTQSIDKSTLITSTNESASNQSSQAQNNNNNNSNQTTTNCNGKTTKSSGSKSSRQSGSTNHLLRQQICTDPRLAPFECHLDNLDLWHRFHPLDTEMIITKQGRRMFPPVRVTFSMGAGAEILSQLNPRDKYQVLMDILPYDNKRYRYAYHKSSWQQAGKADPPSPTKLFLHPDGPFTLEQLKRQVISFEKIKLTNNDANKHGYIVLNSMHKYQPRIHLVLWRGKESQNLANSPIANLDQETHKTFIFSETIFTAVTAYQNHSITKLKIDSNPFAKGFRDSSRLTDLELESMQDLMSDGQCPFSPPRAPPPGFQHLLFAAAAAQHAAAVAQQQQQLTHGSAGQKGGVPGGIGNGPPGPPLGGEDPTSVLLRERTLMSLDSFLQQQQQQQQQQHFSQQQLPPPSGHQMNHQHQHNNNNLNQINQHTTNQNHLSHLQHLNQHQLLSPPNSNLLDGHPSSLPPASTSSPSASSGGGGMLRPNSNGQSRGLDCSISGSLPANNLASTTPTSSSGYSISSSGIASVAGCHPLGLAAPPSHMQQQQPPPMSQSYGSVGIGMNQPPSSQGLPPNFGDLLMQQQRQFAAAMAAGGLNPQQLQQAFMAAHHHQQMASLSMHLSTQYQQQQQQQQQQQRNGAITTTAINTATSGGGAPTNQLAATGGAPAKAHNLAKPV